MLVEGEAEAAEAPHWPLLCLWAGQACSRSLLSSTQREAQGLP